MTYRSILVNLDIDGPVVTLIKLATDLASRFDARLIGCSAADVTPPIIVAEGMALGIDIRSHEREDIETRLAEVRAEFERLAGASVKVEWRGGVANPTRFLAEEARAADLVLTCSSEGASSRNAYRSVNVGRLILDAGRPVIVAANDAERGLATKILVAWKDTREARRALADALPLLSQAQEVVVATVDAEADIVTKGGLADVAAFLAYHGVKARIELIAEAGDGDKLADIARSMDSDLIVSGAYGHSRLREWVFGGVTRSLLDEVGLNRLMAN